MSLVAELQRRRVFRALVGYGIGAFAVLQIIEPVMHGLHWPEVVLTYVVVALAAGFPIVVGLAWIFDVNAGRIERTPSLGHSGSLRGAPLALALVGVGVLAAAPGLVWYFVVRHGDRPSAATLRAPSIAVLPFVNLSGGQENEYFSDGITEEIINALSNVPGVRVVARTSAFSFKGKSLNVRQIAEELNVATVLEGSVRREGNQLRVVAQLVDAANGYHLLSETYDRELQSVFALENELARAIVETLKPRLVQGPDLVVRTTASIEAHDLYLKGRHFWNQRNKEGLARSAALFEQALALDPGYALAHSGLADSCTLSIQYGQTRAAEVLPNARLHARKAVQLDDTLAEGHASLGQIGIVEYQWKTAERELRRAIELRPGYATAHHWYALVLAYTGRAAEARAEAEQARQLDPTSMIINNLVAIMLFESRDYAGSLAQARRALEMNPSSDLPRIWIAISCVQLGKFAEALAALDKLSTQNGQGVRVSVLAASGDRVAARKLLAEIEKRFEVDPLPRGVLARAHLTLGEMDRALHWLEEAVEERDQTVFSLKVNPDWDSIRSEPRYHKLLKRMNLE